MNTNTNFNLLNSTIKWLVKGRKFHICVHDLSGMFHQNQSMQLLQKSTIHSCKFCETAKSTTEGLRFCLKCKELSLKKALNRKEKYVGQCYLGITEIIKPVYYHDKPICVIYLGNIILKENSRGVLEKFEKLNSITGVKSEELKNAVNTVEIIEESMLLEYTEIVDIVSDIISKTVTNETKLQRKSISTKPSYRSTNHWLIENIQNYILAYYNKDLQLSQLAKLYFVNPQYLCRLFKKETGLNFSDYVNSIRINESKHLLTATKYNIVDISIQVGYSNVTYFNRLFKRYTGYTPNEYRSKI